MAIERKVAARLGRSRVVRGAKAGAIG